MAHVPLRYVPAGLVLFLAGCSGGEVAPPTLEAAKAPVLDVSAPAHLDPTPICLVNKRDVVTVGMAPEVALRAFADLRTGGFESEELPPGFKPPYQARSWEDGKNGFGVILYNGVVAAAMYQSEKVSVADLKDMVTEYRVRITDVDSRRVSGAKVKYWFWDLDGERLMICGYTPSSPDQVEVTACMGDANLLDALGMSYEKALANQPEVDGGPRFAIPHPIGSAK